MRMEWSWGEKPWRNTCELISNQKRDLKKRKAKKSFTCAQCGKSLTRKHSLDVHMRVHTGQKPYTSVQCRMSFTRKGHLKVHMSVYTGEKPFTCDQCGKSFTQSANLKEHMNIHNREKLHACDLCGKRFCGLHTWRNTWDVIQRRSHIHVICVETVFLLYKIWGYIRKDMLVWESTCALSVKRRLLHRAV